MTPTVPAPGTPLRDFTVEMLEALPDGARFIDKDDPPSARDGQAITKRNDGGFAYYSANYRANSLLDWAASFDYRLTDPETKALPEESDDTDPTIDTDTNDHAEALTPFAAFGALIPADRDDDEIVMGELMGAPLRVRDFRVAARVMR